MPERVLLVEDEPALAVTLADRLRAEGYSVTSVEDGSIGLEVAVRDIHDVIILDLMLPEVDGLEICRELRSKGLAIPVLMLTARTQLRDKLSGFEVGADDYITKPFEVLELLARVKALLRRNTDRVGGRAVLHFGPNRLDTRTAEVHRHGKPVSLSVKEYNLLHYLLTHPGEIVTRQTLLRKVWHYDEFRTTRTVDVHIGWLRQKLEDRPSKPEWILTVHGRGYRFSPHRTQHGT